MRRENWGVVAGLLVLAVGVISIVGLLRPGDPAGSGVVEPITTPAAVTAETAPPTPALPGVSSRIARVLAWDGDTTYASNAELAQLPRSVSAVLSAYGIPLRIPLTETNG